MAKSEMFKFEVKSWKLILLMIYLFVVYIFVRGIFTKSSDEILVALSGLGVSTTLSLLSWFAGIIIIFGFLWEAIVRLVEIIWFKEEMVEEIRIEVPKKLYDSFVTKENLKYMSGKMAVTPSNDYEVYEALQKKIGEITTELLKQERSEKEVTKNG